MEFNNISEFTKQVADFELKDGDLILVSPILPKKYNYVSIFGNIERPGDYELKKGIMVKDLIGEAQGLLPGTYLKRGEVSRFKANQIREILPFNVELALTGDPVNNLQLQEWDKVMVYAETDVLPECFAKVTGAVSTEGEYKITPNMTIEDLIFESGGYLSTADIKNAELCRMVPEARPMTMKIDLTDSATKKIKLEPNDWLFIRERREWVERQKITITGEVTYPGQYVVEEGERLKSVIERAGGVTKDAFLEGAIYIRQSVKKEQESALRNFLASTKKRLLEESATAELAGAGEIKVIEYREKLLGLISEIRIPGRIQVDLKKLNLPQFNIVIADGDTLYIPKTPTTVQIIGCVYNPSSVLYEEEADMGWYLEQVGGLTRDANKKEIYILKASGKVVKSGKIYRGDTIIVPEGLKIHAPTGKVIKDLATVIYQLGLSALMVSTLMK
jgi:protein involved in polysaccharide export with SLBB domain